MIRSHTERAFDLDAETRRHRHARILAGVLGTMGVAVLAVGTRGFDGTITGDRLVPVVASSGVSGVLLAAAILIERRSEEPDPQSVSFSRTEESSTVELPQVVASQATERSSDLWTFPADKSTGPRSV